MYERPRDRLLRQIRGRKDRGAEELILSTGDIARLFGVSARTVRIWTESGRLEPFRTLGGHRRFKSNQVLELLEAERKRVTRQLNSELDEMPVYSRKRRR